MLDLSPFLFVFLTASVVQQQGEEETYERHSLGVWLSSMFDSLTVIYEMLMTSSVLQHSLGNNLQQKDRHSHCLLVSIGSGLSVEEIHLRYFNEWTLDVAENVAVLVLELSDNNY